MASYYVHGSYKPIGYSYIYSLSGLAYLLDYSYLVNVHTSSRAILYITVPATGDDYDR